jgi:hypothetical protein
MEVFCWRRMDLKPSTRTTNARHPSTIPLSVDLELPVAKGTRTIYILTTPAHTPYASAGGRYPQVNSDMVR